jgi:hypothetical protein
MLIAEVTAMAKNGGGDMQPEFDAHVSEAQAVNYFPPRTGGVIQDELREGTGGGDSPSARQTLGDPEDYGNAASDETANTPVKPRVFPPQDGA